MGIKIVLGLAGKPTAADLAKQIAELDRSIAGIAEEHAIAEAAAIEAASGDKYEDAAAKSAAVKFRLDQAREKLGRLQAAREAAAESEQADYIERCGARVNERRADQQKIVREVAAGRKEEEARHAQALADLSAQECAAQSAVHNAEHDLRRAQAGFPEASATRLKELHKKYLEIEGRYDPNLDNHYQQAQGRLMAARSLIESNRSEHGRARGDILPEWQEEYDKSKKAFDDLQETRRQRNEERRPIREESERIRSTLPDGL
jgi:hypothetical protein